ncbi:hypothetical protein OJ996_08390 [Luteolibacter sp. GHJ8]|uniref:Uncharacterized protein n=1 Tax=Luteolibacter rhizosphaerae TaxID=2989719 RepID=A0ABT3G188_9BACT|nr:hypothetical protein [Luteolibacter rhizosphaerae]MCW1913590.1 hypothetical protein [Luteolibacter rhizosphaerae]
MSPKLHYLLKCIVVVLILVVGWKGLFAVDGSACPPAHLKTLAEFETWLGERKTDRGTFDHEGTRYTILMGKPARALASGPAAYIFDPSDDLVDWTPDMGDFRTVKHGVDLSSRNVKFMDPVGP